MTRKSLPVLFSLAVLLVSPALVRAQGGPPPGGPSFGGFRGGPGRFRFVGFEGCLGGGRPVPSGTPGVAATITRTEEEPVLGGSPVTRTNTYQFYRDNNGVTYEEITLPPMRGSTTPRTLICITDPVLKIHLAVDPAKMTAREFQFPPPPSWANGNNNGGTPPQRPNNGNRPTPPGFTVTHPAPPSSIPANDFTLCTGGATTTLTSRSITVGGASSTATNERVFCSSLLFELYSQSSDPHRVSTTTANISATGTGVNLTSLPVPYPLVGITPTVVTPGRRGAPPSGGSGSPTP